MPHAAASDPTLKARRRKPRVQQTHAALAQMGGCTDTVADAGSSCTSLHLWLFKSAQPCGMLVCSRLF